MPALYLVRHAEPAFKGVLLGACDPPLSEAGKQDAALIDLPRVAVVYTSSLRRARETAATLGAAPAIIDPDLNEISYGEWDGLCWSEIAERYPDQAQAKLTCWPAVTPPGGEKWTDFEMRISRALARIRSGVFPAAVIAHVTVNATIAYLLTGCDSSSFMQGYCEVLNYEI